MVNYTVAPEFCILIGQKSSCNRAQICQCACSLSQVIVFVVKKYYLSTTKNIIVNMLLFSGRRYSFVCLFIY